MTKSGNGESSVLGRCVLVADLFVEVCDECGQYLWDIEICIMLTVRGSCLPQSQARLLWLQTVFVCGL